jgi:hypothetical protein
MNKPLYSERFSKLTIQFLLMLLFFLYLVPISPSFPTDGLDPSWQYVVDYAAMQHFRFGVDVIFTFGPLGRYWFPHYIYNPESYYAALCISALLSVTLSVALYQMVRQFSVIKQVLLLLAIFIGMVMSAHFVWFMLPVLLMILAFKKGANTLDRVVIALLLFFLAFSVLVKFSHLPTAILSVLLIDFYVVYRLKKMPFFSLLFVMLTLVLFVLSGQQIFDVGNWFFGSLQTLTGYSESMQINGNPSMVPLFLIILLGFYYFLYQACKQYIALEIALILLLSTAILFMAFKNGFVRHDGHAIQAVGSMAFMFAIMFAYVYSVMDLSRYYKKWFYGLIFLATILSIHVMGYYQNHINIFQVLSNTVQQFYTNAVLAKNILNSSYKESLDARYLNAKQQIKEKLDLSDVSGTVDIYPWDQAYVIANGLDYRPRPLFQSYSVYTPWLIQKNREFLYGDRAPQTILFGIKDIDNRLPATMEGASWLDIMKLYDVVRVRNVFLQLQKTSHSKDYTLNNLESVKTLFNQSVKVPSENVFVKINVKKNLMGSLVNLLYKMPITEIELEYENGSKEVKRLIPGIVSSGFIISPSIKNINDFAAYASGYDLQKVVAFSIIGNSFLYDDMIGIEFFSIERKGFSSTGLIK